MTVTNRYLVWLLHLHKGSNERKKKKVMDEWDRYCSAVIGEKSIKEALSNDKKHDIIVGLEDMGKLGHSGSFGTDGAWIINTAEATMHIRDIIRQC